MKKRKLDKGNQSLKLEEGQKNMKFDVGTKDCTEKYREILRRHLSCS